MSIKTIVLDTEVFVRLKYDFNHYHFHQLKSLPQSGVYKIAITDVTRKEVESRIKGQVEVHFQSLRKLQNNPLFHRSFELPTFTIKDFETAKEKALSEFNSFISLFDIEIIVSESVNLWNVLDMYFESKAPFSAKKKSEFPDAISLLAIEKHLFKQEAIAISGDRDWIDFFEERKNVETYSNIPELKEYLLAQENSLISLFKEQISIEIPDIKVSIINYLVEKETLIELSNGSSFELNIEQIESIEIESYNIIELKKDVNRLWAYTTCEVNFDISLIISISSVNSSNLHFSTEHNHSEDTVSNSLSVSLLYSVDELNKKPVLSKYFIY